MTSHRIAVWLALAAVLSLAVAASTALVHGEPRPSPEEEMERGRYWHASRLLAGAEDGAGEPLLRARAEAGWGNWPAVWGLLQNPGAVPSTKRTKARVLRARAAEETGRSGEAVASYRAALADGSALGAAEARVLRIRLGRVLAKEGELSEALDVLEEVAADDPVAGSWLALEIGRRAAEEGRAAAVRRAGALITDPEAERRSWDLPARAHLAAGDTAVALIAYLGRAGIPGGGEGWGRIGSLRLALGDSAGARRAFRIAVSRGPEAGAARALLDLGIEGPGVARRSYRALRAAAEHESALTALERWRELAEDPLPDEVRLERARLLSRMERLDEAVEELRLLAASDRAEVAAPALDLWAGIRRRQGRAGDRRILQDRLVERFPSRAEAVDVVFFRADDRHDRGDFSGALDGYRRVVEMAPELDRAGLARMRMGQIHVTRGMHEEAAEVFEGYLDAFPRGRRWDEARFWAAWTRAALDRDEAAREHVRRIQEEDPLSYYAALGARLLGEPFDPAIPEGIAPPEVAAVDTALAAVEMLREAGLEAAVPGRIDALRQRYRASGDSLLRLSLELSERGFSLDGITLAWQIRGEGRAWDRWLVRAAYPYPYQELVRLEAEEWGLEPAYLAALIRQESAFLVDARSVAGAMGLMQVVPATGRSLARSVGPEAFAERHLLHPEVNLHLGAAYLARLHERFDERRALTLAAYNAGPTRARRWERRFPEVEDPLRFTERIPFRETRGYVKRVTRNLDIYRWLYGEEE